MMKDAQFFFVFWFFVFALENMCELNAVSMMIYMEESHWMLTTPTAGYSFNWYVFSVLVLEYDCGTIGCDGSKILCCKGSVRHQKACGTSICMQLNSIPFRLLRLFIAVASIRCSSTYLNSTAADLLVGISYPIVFLACNMHELWISIFFSVSLMNDSGCIPRATAEARHLVCLSRCAASRRHSQPTLMFVIYYCL